MIPMHLKDKTAIQIVAEMKIHHYVKNKEAAFEAVVMRDDDFYIDHLEKLLLQAVEDAIMNAEEVKELMVEGQYNAMPRAVSFLNVVLPAE